MRRGIRAERWRRAALAGVLGAAWLVASYAHGQHNQNSHSSPPPPPHSAPQSQGQPPQAQQQRPPQYQSHPQSNQPAPQSHPYTQPQARPYVPPQGRSAAPQSFVPQNNARPVYPGPPYLGPNTPRP